MTNIKLALLFVLLFVSQAMAWTHGVVTQSGSIQVGGGPLLRQTNVCGVPNTVDPSQYYVPGIAAQSVSTSSCYGSDGWYWPRAYDLNAMGATGQAIAAKYGRYLWIVTPDHPTSSTGNFGDGLDYRSGFSADPQTMPAQMNNQIMQFCGGPASSVTNTYTTNPACAYHIGFLVYAPEDTGNQFHVYNEYTDLSITGPGFALTGNLHSNTTVDGLSSTANLIGGGVNVGSTVTGTGIPAGTFVLSVDNTSSVTITSAATITGSSMLTFKVNALIGHYPGAMRTNDLSPGALWFMYGPVLAQYFPNDFQSFQRPTRISAGNWVSYSSTVYRSGNRLTGPPGDSGIDSNGNRSLAGMITGTNGLDFTRADPPAPGIPTTYRIGTRVINLHAWDPITIGSQVWVPALEDARDVKISNANPAVVTKTAHGYKAGQLVSFVTSIAIGSVVNSGNTFVATITAGSNIVTGIMDTSGLQPGMVVNYPGFIANSPTHLPLTSFPQGTTVLSVDSMTQIHTSIPATHNDTLISFQTLPIPILPGVQYCVLAAGLTTDTFEIGNTCGGAAISTAGSINCYNPATDALCIYIPNGGMYVDRVAVDGITTMNILGTPAPVRISNAYAGVFPGPTFLQDVNASLNCGVMTYYAVRGYFMSANNFGFNTGATYNSGVGALQEQLVDIYSEIVDPVAATTCAPMGVRVSAANDLVSLSWNGSLPTQNYRLYYGFSAASQPFLVGDVIGLSTTYRPNLQTPQVMYFKLVYLNNGAEQGSTVVSTYVSSSTAFVNQHITRALLDGADPVTIDRTYLDGADSLLTAQGMHNACISWSDPHFGVVQNISGIVTKVEDLCGTHKQRLNDLWFCTGVATLCTGASTTSYNPTGLGNTTPGLVHANINSFGIYGGLLDANNHNGRLNPVRQASELTVFASYQRASATGDVTMLATGEFGGVSLQHLGTGNASFGLYDDVGPSQFATASLATTINTPHVVFGTFGCRNAAGVISPTCLANDTSPGNLKIYADNTLGTVPTPALHSNYGVSLFTTLKGTFSSGLQFPWVIGTLNSKFAYGASTSTYTMENNQSNFTMGAVGFFTQEMTAAQVSAFTTFFQNTVSPPVAVHFSPTTYGAVCNGSTDDSTAFTNMLAAMVSWDSNPANISVAGVIQVDMPNTGLCVGTAGANLVKGTGINHQVIYNGQGTAVSGVTDLGTGNGFGFGVAGMAGNNTSQALVNTVRAGATSVQLKDCPGPSCATELALFTVGDWLVLTGTDMGTGSGCGGYPPNPQFFQHLKITAKTPGGQISFGDVIRHDYEQGWPNYCPGTAFQPYGGGPATIYQLPHEWGVDVIYQNMTMTTANPGACGSTTVGKSIQFKNVAIIGNNVACGGFTGASCQAAPSQNLVFKLINATMATGIASDCKLEVDKIIETFIVQGTTVQNFNVQSNSVNQFYLSHSTVNGSMNWTQNTGIYGSTISALNGGAGLGITYGQTIVRNSAITTFQIGGQTQDQFDKIGTMTNGVFLLPRVFQTSGSMGSTGLLTGNIRITVDSTADWNNASIMTPPGPVGGCNGNGANPSISAFTIIDATHFDLPYAMSTTYVSFTTPGSSPGVFTFTSHGLTTNNQVTFGNIDAGVTGITSGTAYWVVAPTLNTFEVSLTRNGTPINIGGTQTSQAYIQCEGQGTPYSKTFWPPPWVIPGANYFFISASSSQFTTVGPIIHVNDVSVNANGSILLSTNQTGSLPVFPGTGVTMKTFSAPQWTASNLTGNDDVVDLSGPNQTPGAPIWSFSQRPYCTSSGLPACHSPSGTPVVPVFGQVVDEIISVDIPYSGTTTTLTASHGTPPPPVQILGNNSTTTTWTTAVDAKTANGASGPRVMTQTTTSGAVGADALNPSGAGAWLQNSQMGIAFSSVPSDWGTTKVTQTFQTTMTGLVNPAQE